jgi:hypothetical protein
VVVRFGWEWGFDLEPPRGTCYIAEQPLGAFVETFWDPRVISGAAVAARALATLRVPATMKLADCSVREARRFGVTLEIGASDDYPLGRRWAAAFDGAGFRGSATASGTIRAATFTA